MLTINNLSVAVEQKPIIQSLSMEIAPGSLHVLMGPNGSGKSSFAYALMGHPAYEITQGSLLLNGHDITSLSIEKRAQAGLFLAFQNPIEIPGVTVFNFLKEAHGAITKEIVSIKEFQQHSFAAMDLLQMDR